MKLLDWDRATELAGGDRDIAIDLLGMLEKSLPQERLRLSEDFARSDFGDLQRSVHRFRGAVCYCGLPKLESAARELEIQLKRGNHNIGSFYQTLIETLDATAEVLREELV